MSQHVSPAECPEQHMFPCSNASEENPTCISELQYCDGVADCPEGSDEPEDCLTGMAAWKIVLCSNAPPPKCITRMLYTR